MGNFGRRTGNVALGDVGAVDGHAEEAGLGQLLNSCLVELTGVQGRDDVAELELEKLAACSCIASRENVRVLSNTPVGRLAV